MADAKISQLPAATTPLVGTELVPIVQSGVTKRVAITDLSSSPSSVSATDIGTAPNEIPLNQYLGNLAYQDSANIAGDVGVGGQLTLPAGTANGILYLNGSKVATSGSTLTYDGANFGAGGYATFTRSSQNVVINPNYAASNTNADISTNNLPISFSPANIERMRLDASGNLGLGVTPSAWSAAERALDIGNTVALVRGGSAELRLMQNSFVNASNQYAYKVTAAASNYEQTAGAHKWYTAPSGTAGNSISFTQAMTLDASGNLLVGKTTVGTAGAGVYLSSSGVGITRTDNYPLTLRRDGSDGDIQLFLKSGTGVGSISVTTSATAYNTSSDYRLKDNQAPLTNSGSFIDALKPKTWNWKADGTKGVGFIAHEVQEVSPTSVVGEKDAMRVEQYEVSPAIPATYDEQGNELTPAVEAVMGEREVPAYQAMEYGSAEFVANIVAELQSLRKRVAALEAK